MVEGPIRLSVIRGSTANAVFPKPILSSHPNPGRHFTIGQATVDIDGQMYKSPPVSWRLLPAVEIPKDGNNADYLASENVTLVAEVSNDKPLP